MYCPTFVRAKHNPLILSPTALKKDFPGNKLKHPMGKKKEKRKNYKIKLLILESITYPWNCHG
jgi:hypothetical protein